MIIEQSTLEHSTTEQSTALFNRAQKVIPGGVNSPVRAFRAVGGVPRFIASAEGAHITDVDGNTYIDYVGSWGPMILGHANLPVVEAIIRAAQKGISYGAPCPDEVLLAEAIVKRFDSIDKVRMVNSGTEATMTAIRLARGVTGRDKIVKFEGCYHGHVDSLLVKAGSGLLTFGAPSSPGVPQNTVKDTLIASFNDLDSVVKLFEKQGEQIACVIIEPIAGNVNLLMPKPGFLAGLRDICDHYGALLILDEVITGFRVGYQGVQSLWDIRPDITTLGKIVGGGMPVGAIGGRADIMDQLSPLGKIYQAGTLSGNPLAMAAGLAMLEQLTPEIYPILAEKTAKLVEGLNVCATAAHVPLTIQHCTGMFGLFFTDKENIETYADVMSCDANRFNTFFNAMLEQGIYLAPSAFEIGFMSLAHTEEDIAKTVAAAERALHL